MSKPKKTVIEYRNYELPINFPVLVLTGDRWYISDVKSGKLHFHNCLEIGICHQDSGFIEFADEPVPFKAGDVTFISRNVAHTSYSTKGESSLWSYIFLNPDDLFKGIFGASSPYGEIYYDMTQNLQMILHGSEHKEIYSLVTQILSELANKEMNYQIAVKGLMLSLFMKLMRVYAGQKKQSIAQRAAHDNDIAIKTVVFVNGIQFLSIGNKLKRYGGTKVFIGFNYINFHHIDINLIYYSDSYIVCQENSLDKKQLKILQIL